MKPRKPTDNESLDTIETPLGVLYLAFTSGFLTGISFKNEKRGRISLRKSAASELVKQEISEYFRGERTEFLCKTAFLEGTEFERRVWNALREVPYGETRSYKWLAEWIGKPQACRAVGRALGKNPLPIVIPCHRIVESNGMPGGYSSGIEVKLRLLEIEYYTRLSRLKGA